MWIIINTSPNFLIICGNPPIFYPYSNLKEHPDNQIQYNPNVVTSLPSNPLHLILAAFSALPISGHPRDLRDPSPLLRVNLSFPSCGQLPLNPLPPPHISMLRPHFPILLFIRVLSVTSVNSLFHSSPSSLFPWASYITRPPHFHSSSLNIHLHLSFFMIVVCIDPFHILIINTMPFDCRWSLITTLQIIILSFMSLFPHLYHRSQQLKTGTHMFKFHFLSISKPFVASAISLLSSSSSTPSICTLCTGSLFSSPLFPLKSYISPSPISINISSS